MTPIRLTLLSLVLALVACGGAGDAATDTSPSTTPPASTTETTIPASDTALPVEAPSVTMPPAPAAPAPADPVRSITIGGMGAEYAQPDRCIVELGVTSRRPSVEASGEAAAASGDALTAALEATGVEPADIQTSDFSVNAYYDDYPTIGGYETHIGYRVTMPAIADIGSALAGAMAAGGDDVRAWGVRFEVDPAGLIDAARAKAWADAESRAQSLATLAGEPLGEVLDVHEKVLLTSSQGMVHGGEGDAVSFDIPVSPGVSGVVVLLTVTFAIGG